MPGRDRTGPEGMGPMTGWGMGDCAGEDDPRFAGPMPGRGYGRGWWGRAWRHGRSWWRGRGRGWRFYAGRRGYGPPWGYPPQLTPDQELEELKGEAEWLKQQLDAVNQRIDKIEE
jgi:hypothetical protein